MDNCAIGFPNFAEILSWIEPCPDSVALASGRSHFSCTQFPYQSLARPDHSICRSDSWSDACNFHIWSSTTRTMKTVVRTSEIWMLNLPYLWACPDRNPHRPDGSAVFPYLCFEKKSHSWSNTEWRPDVLLRRSDGCKLEQFEASRHKGRSGWKVLVVRTNDAWTVERLDGISRRSDGCKGTEFNCLEIRTVLWRTKHKCRFWIKQLPCIKSSLHRSDFVQ
jgi:hypothetical protein